MSELLELLTALSGLRGVIMHSDSKKAKHRQAAVFKWIRNVESEALHDIHRISGTCTCVSDFVGLLQFILVMSSHPPHRVVLCWDPQGRPMIPKSNHDAVEPDLGYLKRESQILLNSTKIIWNGASPAEMIISPVVELLPIFLTLSGGRCFTYLPKSFDNVREILWLRSLPRFSLAQYVTAIAELSIWQTWVNPRAKPQPSSQILQMRNALVKVIQSDIKIYKELSNYNISKYPTHFNTRIFSKEELEKNSSNHQSQYHNTKDQFLNILYSKQIIVSFEEIFSNDDGKVGFLLSVMKQRLKYFHEYSNAFTNKSIQYLWMISSIANKYCHFPSDPPSRRSPISPQNRHPNLWVQIDNILAIGILDSYSPFHEFQTRFRDRLLTMASDIVSIELIKMMERDSSTSSSSSNNTHVLRPEPQHSVTILKGHSDSGVTDKSRQVDAAEQQQQVSTAHSKASKAALKKKKQKQKKKTEKSLNYIVPSSKLSQSSEEVASTQLTTPKEILTSDVMIVTSIAPRDVTDVIRNKTQVQVDVVKIIQDIIEVVFETIQIKYMELTSMKQQLLIKDMNYIEKSEGKRSLERRHYCNIGKDSSSSSSNREPRHVSTSLESYVFDETKFPKLPSELDKKKEVKTNHKSHPSQQSIPPKAVSVTPTRKQNRSEVTGQTMAMEFDTDGEGDGDCASTVSDSRSVESTMYDLMEPLSSSYYLAANHIASSGSSSTNPFYYTHLQHQHQQQIQLSSDRVAVHAIMSRIPLSIPSNMSMDSNTNNMNTNSEWDYESQYPHGLYLPQQLDPLSFQSTNIPLTIPNNNVMNSFTNMNNYDHNNDHQTSSSVSNKGHPIHHPDNNWTCYPSADGNWYYYDYPIRASPSWDESRWTNINKSINSIIDDYNFPPVPSQLEYLLQDGSSQYESSDQGDNDVSETDIPETDERLEDSSPLIMEINTILIDPLGTRSLQDVSFHTPLISSQEESQSQGLYQNESSDLNEDIISNSTSTQADEEIQPIKSSPSKAYGLSTVTPPSSGKERVGSEPLTATSSSPQAINQGMTTSPIGDEDAQATTRAIPPRLRTRTRSFTQVTTNYGSENNNVDGSRSTQSSKSKDFESKSKYSFVTAHPVTTLSDPIAIVLSSACLRSQSQTSVLVNQLAVQRSLIGSLESSISGQLQPVLLGSEYRPHPSFGNPSLEVMSDDGDSLPTVRRIIRGGQATIPNSISPAPDQIPLRTELNNLSNSSTPRKPQSRNSLNARIAPPLPRSVTTFEGSIGSLGSESNLRNDAVTDRSPLILSKNRRDPKELEFLSSRPQQRLHSSAIELLPGDKSTFVMKMSKAISLPRVPESDIPKNLNHSLDEEPGTSNKKIISSQETEEKSEGLDTLEYKQKEHTNELYTYGIEKTSSDMLIDGDGDALAISVNEHMSTTQNDEQQQQKQQPSTPPNNVIVSICTPKVGIDGDLPRATILSETRSNRNSSQINNSNNNNTSNNNIPTRPVSAVSQMRYKSSGVENQKMNGRKASREHGNNAQFDIMASPPNPLSSTSTSTSFPATYQSWPGLTSFGRLGTPHNVPNLTWSPSTQIQSILTREIVQFVATIDRAATTRHREKLDAIARVRVAVQSLWPRAQVKPFGSFVTGLSLPVSDLDLVICLPKVRKEAGPEAPGALEGRNAIKETWQQNLARFLRKEDWVDANSITVIPNAQVPVIKLQTKHKISLDISFEAQDHSGLQARKYHAVLLRQYPALRPLVLVLKTFLTRRGLCEAYTGGLSSYALLLITTRFLQEQQSILDVGSILLGLLNFFGDHLDPRVTGISVLRRCYFSRIGVSGIPRTLPTNRRGDNFTGHMSYVPFKFDPLFVEDPLAPGNNVGRNCFRIYQIQRMWSETHNLLLNEIKRMEEEGIPHPLLEILVGKIEDFR